MTETRQLAAEPGDTLLRVRFAETDQMGIAHHSAYLVWLEVARVEWLRALGLSYRALETEGVSLAVSEASVRYRSATAFDDELLLRTRLTELRSRRCRFDYRIHRPAEGSLIATAVTLHTPTDASGRAVRLPAAWLDQLADQVTAWQE
jgi:acyl-CoA thioester hydrolase